MFFKLDSKTRTQNRGVFFTGEDGPVGRFDGAEQVELAQGAGHQIGRRRVHEVETRRIGHAQRQQLQHHARQAAALESNIRGRHPNPK